MTSPVIHYDAGKKCEVTIITMVSDQAEGGPGNTSLTDHFLLSLSKSQGWQHYALF